MVTPVHQHWSYHSLALSDRYNPSRCDHTITLSNITKTSNNQHNNVNIHPWDLTERPRWSELIIAAYNQTSWLGLSYWRSDICPSKPPFWTDYNLPVTYVITTVPAASHRNHNCDVQALTHWPLEIWMKFQALNFPENFNDWWLSYLLWTCS